MKALSKIALTATVALATWFAPTTSSASTDSGFMLGLSVMRLSTSYDGPQLGNGESTTTLLNGKIGYTMPTGLYFGGVYDLRTDENGGAKQERSSLGASLGYHSGGWFIDGSYYLSSAIKIPGGSELKEGSGFGVDVGRNFDIAQNVYLGVQVSWKSFSYKKFNSAEVTNKIKSELLPLVNLGLTF